MRNRSIVFVIRDKKFLWKNCVTKEEPFTQFLVVESMDEQPIKEVRWMNLNETAEKVIVLVQYPLL